MQSQKEQGLTLTVLETARLLKISRGLCFRMVREGRISSVRFGRRILVPRHALERLLECQDGGLRHGPGGGVSGVGR